MDCAFPNGKKLIEKVIITLLLLLRRGNTLGRTFVYSAPGPDHSRPFPCVPSHWMATDSTPGV